MSVSEQQTSHEVHSWRGMFLLVLPVFCEEFANLLVGYTDWYLAGRFLSGDATKAAMSLVAYAMWLLPSIFALPGIGATAIVSRYVGARETAQASRVANQALCLGCWLSILAMFAVWLGARGFTQAMQLEPEAAALAERYLWIISYSLPFLMVEQVLAACLRAAGDTWTGFLAKVVVNVLNMLLSTVFVIGWGPFPNLGWDGLAWGTTIGHVVAGLILLALFLRGRAGLQFRWADFWPERELFVRLLRVGVPGGCDQLAIIACHLIYVSIINRLGTTAAAAHGVGLQIEAMSYLPGTAFQVAAATIAGQALGARREQAAMHGIMRTWFAATLVMGCAAVIFYTCGWWLTQFFNGGEPDAATLLATQLLKIVPFGIPSLTAIMVLTGGLRGAGDTRIPLLITFVGLIGIRIPLAAFLAWDSIPLTAEWSLSGWDLGVRGAWIAMVIDAVVRSVLVVWRFFQGGWRKINV